jgi:hypothetical protein
MQMQHKVTSTAFHPKAFDYLEKGRSSGLPHLNNLPVLKQWYFYLDFFNLMKATLQLRG